MEGAAHGTRHTICTRCVMDTSDPNIEFDEQGICNHCKHFDQIYRAYVFEGEKARHQLSKIVSEIKAKGNDQKYDCILGLSGGVDSTYVAYQAKALGLRPLGIHLDNGWNSELAARNIERIAQKLKIDVETHTVDWEEFRDLQLAFLKASVVDIEMVTDHAITASLYQLADKKGIKFILSGANIVTEGIMPKAWGHLKSDLKNIKAIQKRFGTRKITSFPTASILRLQSYKYLKGIKTINLLNYIEYNKKDAMAVLQSELGWEYYGGKHYESVFTCFYQAYILPTKFNIDKRKAHLSSLICSGQLTRAEAIEELKQDLYASGQLSDDKEYVIEKLGLSPEEFEVIMKSPPRSHLDFSSYAPLVNFLLGAKGMVRSTLKLGRYE